MTGTPPRPPPPPRYEARNTDGSAGSRHLSRLDAVLPSVVTIRLRGGGPPSDNHPRRTKRTYGVRPHDFAGALRGSLPDSPARVRRARQRQRFGGLAAPVPLEHRARLVAQGHGAAFGS